MKLALLECAWCGNAAHQNENRVYCTAGHCENEGSTPTDWNDRTMEALIHRKEWLRESAGRKLEQANQIEKRLETLSAYRAYPTRET